MKNISINDIGGTLEEAVIMQKIRELYKRYRYVEGWLIIARFLLWGFIISALWVLVIKITGFFTESLPYFFIPVIISVIVGLIWSKTRPLTLMDVALKSDEKLCLKEKLSTSLEWIEENRSRTPMYRGLLRDASASAEKIEPKTIFPVTWKKPVKKLALVCFVLISFGFMPFFSFFTSPVNPDEVKVIKEEARKIESFTKKLENKKPQTPNSKTALKRTEKSLKNLARDLAKPNTGKKEALMKISKAQEEIKPDLEKARQLEKVQEALKKATQEDENNQDKNKEQSFATMSQKLKNLASKTGEKPLSEDKKKEIEQELEKLKKQMSDAGMKTDKVDKALEQLKKGDTSSAQQSLQEESDQFQNMDKELEDMQDVKDASETLEQSKQNVQSCECKSDKQANTDGAGKEFKEGKNNGKEKVPADFGKGSTNKEQKADKNKKPSDTYVDRHSKDKKSLKGAYEKLYKPERDEMSSALTKVKGKINKGSAGKSRITNLRGAPNSTANAQVDATDEFAEYRAVGEDAVKKEKIPPKYKNLVKNYYNSIEPDK